MEDVQALYSKFTDKCVGMFLQAAILGKSFKIRKPTIVSLTKSFFFRHVSGWAGSSSLLRREGEECQKRKTERTELKCQHFGKEKIKSSVSEDDKGWKRVPSLLQSFTFTKNKVVPLSSLPLEYCFYDDESSFFSKLSMGIPLFQPVISSGQY